ncbi:putative integral membrane protein [Cryptosporidium felis]|nr:putative integral membrane protein [Cryptosporidium felis]
MKSKWVDASLLLTAFLTQSIFWNKEVFIQCNERFAFVESFESPFNDDGVTQNSFLFSQSPGTRSPRIIPGARLTLYGPLEPTPLSTELGRQLAAELNSIRNPDRNIIPERTGTGRLQVAEKSAATKNKDQVKGHKKKPKSTSATTHMSLKSSILTQNSEYFTPVSPEIGKGVRLSDRCLFSPTPMKTPKEDSYWSKIDESKLDVDQLKIDTSFISSKDPFRSSSECLNLYEAALNAFKKKELLISPEDFVGIVRHVAMQLRDSLLSLKYVVSTEDICLAMRIMIFLPHPLRNTVNCGSAIISSLRDQEEISNFELLGYEHEHLETKFKDIFYSCKVSLKFNEPLNHLNEKVTYGPSEFAKLFSLHLTVKDLQFFHRLSIPHRKAALTVQYSYLKHTKKTLLYDLAAAVIFLLNELHSIDHSIEQCKVIVTTCTQQSGEGDLPLSPDISEKICRELGISFTSKRIKVKYNAHILLQLLKRQTHMKPIIEGGLASSDTLPSGKSLLPTSIYGFQTTPSKSKIWKSVGVVLSDGTISSPKIPACTGIPAFEFNRFILINTMIERYLIVSGLGTIKLTVEDVCLITKYYLAYKNYRSESGNELSVDDIIPQAIYKVTQNLKLEVFTISACREIYREFMAEEESVLRKIKGSNYRAKLEVYYSKPPFSFHPSVTLRHLPRIMVEDFEIGTWKIFRKDDICSQIKHYILNRILLFVAYVLEFWRNNRPSEVSPFKSIFEVCRGFSKFSEVVKPSEQFKEFSADWLFEVDSTNLHSTIIEGIWNKFLIYEKAAFPKGSEEPELEYLKRVYNIPLVAEPLFRDDWERIELPIRMDIAEFIKLLPFIEKPVEILSTLDETSINRITLIRGFLESFFEETYHFPVIIPEKDILLLLDRRELEKESMDDLFFEVMTNKSGWSWLRRETSAHAMLKLLEYLKIVHNSVRERIKKEPTNKDIYSLPRATLNHGKWLFKAPQPIFSLANSSQKRALQGLPKFLLNKARFIQVYFIEAFLHVLQFNLSLHLADVVFALTTCSGNENRLIEILKERITSQNSQGFVTEEIVREIYTACSSFSFFRYTLKGALSEEQAFASPRVFYKPKFGWKFLPPNVPDFSRLSVLSKIFRSEVSDGSGNTNSQTNEELVSKLSVRAYTWPTLKGFLDQGKLEIWQLNRAISMCAFFNHWISFKFPKRTSKDIKVSSCINSIYRLKSTSGRYSQSEVAQVFMRNIGIPYLKEGDVMEMLSAFKSFESTGKPSNMGNRQWLMELYRIPQIQEDSKNSLTKEFVSLRFQTPPIFGEQGAIQRNEEGYLNKHKNVPEIFFPDNLTTNSISNLKGLIEKFIIRYLDRVNALEGREVENLGSLTSLIFERCIGTGKASLSVALKELLDKIDFSIPLNTHKKLSDAFYKYVTLKFIGSRDESFGEIIARISASRILTDEGDLPFDIPVGIVPGKINLDYPYNSSSFGEVNFARLAIAYLNEYIIEHFSLRSKIPSDGILDRGLYNELPKFVNEKCFSRGMEIIKKGDQDLNNALEQSCMPELPWLNSKTLRMLISGLMTYCKLNSRNFPTSLTGRNILKFAKEYFNFPHVVFDNSLNTWTMKNVRIQPTETGTDKIHSGYSTLESIGEVDQSTGVLTSINFGFCSEMKVTQVNRLLAKLQYFRHCILENSPSFSEFVDRFLDLNIWCLALRQMVPSMRKTHANILFTYFGIPGTVKQSYEILEDSFVVVEESWLEATPLKPYQQRIHDCYVSPTKSLLQINSFAKSGELFCPRIIFEEDLLSLQSIDENTLNRIEAFQGFSEIFFRERYGMVFEARYSLVALLVDGFSKIENSNSTLNLIRSIFPGISEQASRLLIEKFNSFELKLLDGGLATLKDVYSNPVSEFVQGGWYFYTDLEIIKNNEEIHSKDSFNQYEMNRISTIVSFINLALIHKYSDKIGSSYVTYRQIALFLKANIDHSSFTQSLHYFYEILQDELIFSPWLTVNALRGILRAFIAWENVEIFKNSSNNLQVEGFFVPNEKLKSRYINSPVGIVNGKWHWYSWCRKPNFDVIIKREAILGDEIVHALSPYEQKVFGDSSIKHRFETATLFIQFFLQEMLSILVPFSPETTIQIFKGETALPVESVEFLKSIWEHYKNSYIYKGVLPKNDLFHNSIIKIINRQRFFPLGGFPQFDFFDTSTIPSSLSTIGNIYGGYNAGSKMGVHRLVSICAFINLSFEEFIVNSSASEEILDPVHIFPIFKNALDTPINEVTNEFIHLLKKDFPLYSNNHHKLSRLKVTLERYDQFEKSMFEKGFSISKLYEKQLAIAIQNGYKLSYNMKDYLPQ